MDLLPLLSGGIPRPLDVRRLRDLLSPARVRREMEERGAKPGDLSSIFSAAILLAPDIDEAIDPAAVPDVPGAVDDVVKAVVELLDGPAAVVALAIVYQRAVRSGVLAEGSDEPLVRPRREALRAAMRGAILLPALARLRGRVSTGPPPEETPDPPTQPGAGS